MNRPAFLSPSGILPAGELREALLPFRNAASSIVMLSVMLNVLALSGSIYLMLVYDKVLLSGSIQTLTTIFIILIVLYIFQGIFDSLRARILQMTGEGFDRAIAPRLQQLETDLALQGKLAGMPSTPLRDLDHIRSFLSSQGPAAIIDLPWIVFFLIILSLLHPALGITTLVGAIALGIVTWLNDRQTRDGVEAVNRLGRDRNIATERMRRGLDAIKGLAITGRMNELAEQAHTRFVGAQARLSRFIAKYTALSRGLRMFIQSAVLTVGALLVIDGKASAGVIFASSILAGRALAPVDQAIANWRGFVGARQAWTRLDQSLRNNPPEPALSVTLAMPAKSVSLDKVSVVPPGSPAAVVSDVSLTLAAGDALAVVGPSGSGKSTLSRAITNIWPPASGTIRLDDAPLDQYHEHRLRAAMGYLPQEVELFAGTVAQNIARFDPDPPSEKVVAAARAAGIHEFVLSLPSGYDSPVGDGGAVLSAGQRQRVALARALYGEPFLLVLDEPDSNLDPEGETALGAAIAGVRKRGGIVVVVTHRVALLKEVNQMLVLRAGKQQAFGPRDQVLAALNRTSSPEGTVTSTRAAPNKRHSEKI
jgi:ATP-binding cassette subfamily C protein PrsD